MRVLVVEDEARMAQLIKGSLTRSGVAADVADSGEEALWRAQSVDYDGIVLDVMLPGMSGFAACRALREHGLWSPVLMLTARESVEDRVAGLDSGADDYLVKPFALAELHARLRSLARRRQPELEPWPSSTRSPALTGGSPKRRTVARAPRSGSPCLRRASPTWGAPTARVQRV
jgi:two-component system, OmpR family, response regulator